MTRRFRLSLARCARAQCGIAATGFVCLFVYLSVCLFVCLSVGPSGRLFSGRVVRSFRADDLGFVGRCPLVRVVR